jgi:formylglycine-generating enzyme required for sulfatase activity
VARFDILRFVGEGGFGWVYEAFDPTLKRVVALKVAKPEQLSSAERVARFQREASSAATLAHPHIVGVFDAGQDGPHHYIATTFVAGRSLHALLGDNPGRGLPPRDAAGLVRKVAEALSYAHKSGVVHRDVKPSNVLLNDRGEPMLADFGLAARADETEPRLTQQGLGVGTPQFMAPEQWRGEAGPASDQYSLGCVLFELLTGRLPFEGRNEAHHMFLHLNEPALSPRTLRPDLPRDLETICLKCLEKDPGRRFSDCQDLADELRRWLEGEPIRTRRTGTLEKAAKWCRKRPTTAALLAALFVVTAAAMTTITLLYRNAVAETERARSAETGRVQAQVEALFTAAPQAVPGILDGLAPYREQIRPRLEEARRQAAPGSESAVARLARRQRQRRSALALLPDDDGQVDYLRDEMLDGELPPDETLLVRDALAPHGVGLRPGLWATVDRRESSAARKYRALVALALFDADNPRWEKAGADLAGSLLSENVLHLGTWVRAVAPVRRRLIGPTAVLFRTGKAEQKQVAALVLADIAAEEPPELARLLVDANARQYAVLEPVLRRHREEAARLMRAQLAALPDYWQDAPLEPAWKEVPAALRRQVEQASGLFADRWAMCQALPMAQLTAVAEGLRASGYRPVRVRPWGEPGPVRAGSKVRVAVVWARDGRPWKLAAGLTAAEVQARAADGAKAGWVAGDVAGYETKGKDRYALLLRQKEKGETAEVYAGVAASEHDGRTTGLTRAGFAPATVQRRTDPRGVVRTSGVWWKGEKKPEGPRLVPGTDQYTHADAVWAGEGLLLDVSVVPALPPASPRQRWLADLARAEQDYATNPRNVNALWRKAQALARLGRDREALPVLDALCKRYPADAPLFVERALVHARAGRAGEARRDLDAFRKLAPQANHAKAEALASAFLGRPEAFAALEQALRDDPKNARLAYDVACVYARAAGWERVRRGAWAAGLVASPRTWGLAVAPEDRSGAHARRALVLLRQAKALGFANLSLLRTEADLVALRDQPGFTELLAECGLLRGYASAWRDDATREATGLHGLAPEEHLERCRRLAALGWRPAALSLTTVAGEKSPVAASVWNRPVQARERERHAARQAAAAATLLRLGDAEPAWPLWRHSPDPTARSYLVRDAALLGVDARLLVRRLGVEKDASARRALIVALGDYTAGDLPDEVRAPLVKKLLRWYRDDPDPGVHGAIDWLLRHGEEGPEKRPLDWGQGKELDRIDAELAKASRERERPEGARRRWYVNGQGQTFTRIQGPVEFRMGSPLGEEDRYADEKPHIRRIPRGFDVATKPVTVAQWRQFVKERPEFGYKYTKKYSPGEATPIISVTMYDAMAYCNWLSEKEGIDRREWCYPDKIEPGMKPLAGYLNRKGYRLLTEAEWEYAARAGSRGSRYYGSSEDLLPRYAWFLGNARNRSWPVGQKRPNDLGLFDMHGYVWTWCQDYALLYGSGKVEDKEEIRDINNNDSRILRGASFYHTARVVRSATRFNLRPDVRLYFNGLRVVRTSPGSAQ